MRRRLVALASTALAVAALSGVGLANASVQPATATATEHFQILQTSATSHEFTLIATGEFTAVGTFESSTGTSGTVTLPGGTLKITGVTGSPSQFFNTKTCLLVFYQDGSYTLSDGTGAYADVTGSGTSKVKVLGITTTSGGVCTHTFTAFQEVITGSGPITK
jgi:hypothetical protein